VTQVAARHGRNGGTQEAEQSASASGDEWAGEFAGGAGDGLEHDGAHADQAPAHPGVPTGGLVLVQAPGGFQAWKSSSVFHLQPTASTKTARATGAVEWQREKENSSVQR